MKKRNVPYHITLLDLSALCFQLVHLVTLLMAVQPPLTSTEDMKHAARWFW